MADILDDVERDRIQTGPELDEILGLERGTMTAPSLDWLEFMHSGDRERFKAMLDAIIEVRRGRLNQEFRLRAEDGHYRWFLRVDEREKVEDRMRTGT